MVLRDAPEFCDEASVAGRRRSVVFTRQHAEKVWLKDLIKWNKLYTKVLRSQGVLLERIHIDIFLLETV